MCHQTSITRGRFVLSLERLKLWPQLNVTLIWLHSYRPEELWMWHVTPTFMMWNSDSTTQCFLRSFSWPHRLQTEHHRHSTSRFFKFIFFHIHVRRIFAIKHKWNFVLLYTNSCLLLDRYSSSSSEDHKDIRTPCRARTDLASFLFAPDWCVPASFPEDSRTYSASGSGAGSAATVPKELACCSPQSKWRHTLSKQEQLETEFSDDVYLGQDYESVSDLHELSWLHTAHDHLQAAAVETSLSQINVHYLHTILYQPKTW